MNIMKVPGPAPDTADMINHQMSYMQARQEKMLAEAEELKKDGKTNLPPQRKVALIDKELYIPYQCAIDSILDDTFETQPLIVQMMQGWMAQAFRRFAQKNPDYQNVVITCATKIQLKDAGRDFGKIMPAAERPQANHVFKTLFKLKQIGKPFESGVWSYYKVADFPDRIKKDFMYPAIEDAMPTLLKHLKNNRIQLLLGTDFTFTLPIALRDHPDFKAQWGAMEVIPHIDGTTVLRSTPLHTFKFI